MDITSFKDEINKLLDSLDEKQTELASIRATMLVNFGVGERQYSNLINESMSTNAMIINVFEFFHKKLSECQK